MQILYFMNGLVNQMSNIALIIGSGPIVIGQSAEFDYAGVQALIALREAGYKTVVLNSNPATIMTDNSIADRVYIEPMTLETVEKIIQREKINCILPTFGGQTGLNMGCLLYESGILEKYGVKFIGTNIEAVKLAEDRKLFAEFLRSIGEDPVESAAFTDLEAALLFAKKIKFPVMIRSAFTLGGTGSGVVHNEEEFRKIATLGINSSTIGQILVEGSLYGWKEIEYEVIRDKNDTCIAICNMENIDPVGVHTGDSIVVTPSQTLDDKTYQKLRSLSIKIVRNLKIEGACNVQLAVSPDNAKCCVIEVNPRLSRSSALASKATGYPIAKIAANIAIGKNLHEIKNFMTKNSSAACEPVIDYVVVKIPKWNFEKFKVTDRTIGTQMQSTGEVMVIDRSFEGALVKGLFTLYNEAIFAPSKEISEDLLEKIKVPSADRLMQILNLLKSGVKIEKIAQNTGITPWFLKKMQNIAEILNKVSQKNSLTPEDENLALQYGIHWEILQKYVPNTKKSNYVYKKVDSCAAEFKCNSNYLYSAHNESSETAQINGENAVIIIGSGPIAVGQGIEFDYSCVHAIKEVKNFKHQAFVLNNNPETLSTDFDMADCLFFEPMKAEYLLNIVRTFNPMGVIFQCGGQMALKMAFDIHATGTKVPVLGTAIQSMVDTENRATFHEKMGEIGVLYPKTILIHSEKCIAEKAKDIFYPAIARPSFVIGGYGIKILRNEAEFLNYISSVHPESYPIVIDEYVQGLEVEIDGISDGENVFIPAILEHIEESGVHSGDSIAIYPDNLPEDLRKNILKITQKICKKFNIIGFINIQFIIKNGEIYTIEVNPRASRTIPVITKIMGINMVKMAISCMFGGKIETALLSKKDIFVAKIPVFSTRKIPKAGMNLSPEMKSTGEVIGIGKSAQESFYKGMISAGYKLNKESKIFLLADNPEITGNLISKLKKLYKEIEVYSSGEIEEMLLKIQHAKSSDILCNLTENNFSQSQVGSMQYFSNLHTFLTYLKAAEYAFSSENIVNIMSISEYF